MHDLVGLRRIGEVGEVGLILKWTCQHPRQLLEGLEIIEHSSRDDFLDAVVSWNECGVRSSHRGFAVLLASGFGS